jgi:uncharacterized protein
MILKQLDVTDYKKLKVFFENQQNRLSTYSLLSLIAWSNPKLIAYYTIENNTLIIGNKSYNKPEDNHLILPVSPTEKITPEYLFVIAKKLGFSSYWFIPEDFLLKYDRQEIEFYFTVTAQTKFDDYIYLTEDLVCLKGNKYIKQRNLIHQFYKTYLDRGKVDIEMISPDNAKDCLNFLQEWCDLRKCDLDQNEDLACEKMATTTALNNIDTLEARGLLIRIDSVVSAFGISSILTDNMGVLNFEKAYPHIKGLYQFLDNECSKRLFKGYKYINKESDMNLPNLAQSKKSYNPVMKVKSYRLTMR